MHSRGQGPRKRVWATGRAALGSGVAGPGVCAPAAAAAAGPVWPGPSRLPRESAPHSCPGLYLTSGPRPAAAAPHRAPY